MARSCSSLEAGIRPIEKKDFTCSGARLDHQLTQLCYATTYDELWERFNAVLAKGKFDPLDTRIPLIYRDIRAAGRLARPMRRSTNEDKDVKIWNDYLALVGRLPAYIPYAISAEIIFRIQALITEQEMHHAVHNIKSCQPNECYFV